MKRRNLLIGAAAALGGGLAVGLVLRDRHFSQQAAELTKSDGSKLFGGWLRIATTGEVTLYLPHSDMGQGASTGIAMMVADELDADWKTMKPVQAPAEPAFANRFFLQGFLLGERSVPDLVQPALGTAFGEIARLAHLQMTGGSASIRTTGQGGMRMVAAAARDMLVRAAAARWNVPAAELTVRDSVVSHRPTGRQAGFGELAAAAAELSPPRWPKLKTRAQMRLVGRSTPRVDIPAKVKGEAKYGIDVQMPGLLVATVKAAPVQGAKLESVEIEPALRIAGVRKVVKMERAVAVVADGYWPARQGLAQLQPVFGKTADDGVDSATQSAKLRAALDGELETVNEIGEPFAGPASRTVVAQYEVPFLHHATMEPINVTARFADGRLEVWGSEQDALGAKYNLVAITGLEPAAIEFHPMLLGGGFGRRSAPKKDHLDQAWQLARAMSPEPVKLIWSREEDFAQGAYRPAVVTTLEARLGGDGKPASWEQQANDTPGLINEGWPIGYAIPYQRMQSAASPVHTRTGAWRSVAHSQHGFFTECFMDELAAAAGRDPYEYRRDLLPADSRKRRVLDEAARLSGWRTAPPAGRGRGIALVESFGSIVAEVVEASVEADGTPRVHRVVAVVDCGLLVNPDSGRQQVEGAIIMGLSAALGEAITIKDGAVVQKSYPDYPIMRMAQTPKIEVHFIDSDEAPGGLGEVGLPPAAPALVNALARLGVPRIRKLPIGKVATELKVA
ncbi:molybdopterin cofactor-binding domain-containing protein [Ramlibacter sp.]|uniref:xanthine dehydrogenase family protein molybdopterin-binding subunit n=1 Tax=Ramlibacter sp. TaxID=1917967 RepID=UPI003D0B41E3